VSVAQAADEAVRGLLLDPMRASSTA